MTNVRQYRNKEMQQLKALYNTLRPIFILPFLLFNIYLKLLVIIEKKININPNEI